MPDSLPTCLQAWHGKPQAAIARLTLVTYSSDSKPYWRSKGQNEAYFKQLPQVIQVNNKAAPSVNQGCCPIYIRAQIKASGRQAFV